MTKIPKDIRCSFKIKELYAAALCDDCTRLTYAEILKDKKALTLTYFMARSLSWFKQIYNFEFETALLHEYYKSMRYHSLTLLSQC